VGTRLDVQVPLELGTMSLESEHADRLRRTEPA
jgi:hypothetical protein